VYFALADAADDSQKAIELLESVLTKTRQKSTVQVALARVHLQKNQLDKARALLVEAAKDPHDYEANALLGQLLLEAGVPPELALEPLQRAVERNGSHPPARHLLTRTLLALGRVEPALKGIEAWLLDNPTLELAWKDAGADLPGGRPPEGCRERRQPHAPGQRGPGVLAPEGAGAVRTR
jgi:thioredoxin-like negative regulator of GroEL